MIRDKGMMPAKKVINLEKNSVRQKIPRIIAIKPPIIFFMPKSLSFKCFNFNCAGWFAIFHYMYCDMGNIVKELGAKENCSWINSILFLPLSCPANRGEPGLLNIGGKRRANMTHLIDKILFQDLLSCDPGEVTKRTGALYAVNPFPWQTRPFLSRSPQRFQWPYFCGWGMKSLEARQTYCLIRPFPSTCPWTLFMPWP